MAEAASLNTRPGALDTAPRVPLVSICTDTASAQDRTVTHSHWGSEAGSARSHLAPVRHTAFRGFAFLA